MIATAMCLSIHSSDLGEQKMENPNPDRSIEKTEETKQYKTTDLLNPMSGYVQHTNPLFRS